MDLRKLRSLLAIIDSGSFSKAARSVNLTQSAVSQHVHELEMELGILLFDRSTRPPKLTGSGKAYAETARSILALQYSFLETYGRKGLTGKLVIGFLRSLLGRPFLGALQALREHHPGVKISLLTAGKLSDDLIEGVLGGQLDVAVVIGPPNTTDGLVWRSLTVERYFVIAPRTAVGSTDVELLVGNPYLRFLPNLPGERRIDSDIRRRNVNIDPAMQLDTFDSIALLVSHGLGVGIVPELYLHSIDTNKVRYMVFGDGSVTRDVGLVFRERHPLLPLIELFWSVIASRAGPISSPSLPLTKARHNGEGGGTGDAG